MSTSTTAPTNAWAALWAVLAFAALVGLGYVAAIAWSKLNPPPAFNAQMDPDCNLRMTACTADFGNGKIIRLDMEPKTLPPMEPVRISVETIGIDPDHLTVEFTGVDMNMGLVKADMLDVGGGDFAGDAIIPICVRRRMTWQALVKARGDEGLFGASFTFDVVSPY